MFYQPCLMIDTTRFRCFGPGVGRKRLVGLLPLTWKGLGSEGMEIFHLVVAYQFSIGGVVLAACIFPQRRVLAASHRIRVHQQIAVRCRSDDPSINRLDRRARGRVGNGFVHSAVWSRNGYRISPGHQFG